MKRFFCLILISAVIFAAFPAVNAGAVYNDYIEGGFYSDCYILVCTDNDEIIFSNNINKQSKPASLTKIVTASVILEEVPDLQQVVTVPQKCLDELANTGSSTGGLMAGETYTVYNLLCCLLLESANEAATTLADFLTGDDRDAFVDKMNSLAAKLGCDNTNFVNVHGLDNDDQYTTVSDVAKLLENAMTYSVFSEITSMLSYDLPASNLQKERTIRTTNYTLSSAYKDYYNKNIKGGKTGFTSGAGHCLAVSASNNGYNYIAVAMNAPKEDLDDDGYEENGAFMDCRAMLDWAFENLSLISIADAAKVVAEVPVRFGKSADFVTLCPSDSAFSLMPKGVDAGSLLVRVKEGTVPDHVTAPIKKGEYICDGEVLYAGDVIAEIELVASTEIKRSLLSFFGTLFVDMFSSAVFKLVVILIVVALAVLIFLRRSGRLKSKKDTYDTVNYNDFFNK